MDLMIFIVAVICVLMLVVCFIISDFGMIINIALIHLDKNNNYINISHLQKFTSETIELDIGYKLNHYNWDYEKHTLELFIKPANYDINITEEKRIRKLILPHITNPLLIKETYTGGV